MMRAKFLPTVALLACLTLSASWTSQQAAPVSPTPIKITGDYVESRTASVLAGACHYNGELVTTGREAVMAWEFHGGKFQGVNLAGVKAAAAVSADKSLGFEDAKRKTEIAVDTKATSEQVAAVVALLKAKMGAQLGDVVAVRRAPVVFTHGETGYVISAKGFAEMAVEYRADMTCCIQPNLVWYTPLMELEHRKVGFTDNASYSGAVGDAWQRQGEDSAFYGEFTF